MLSLEAAIEKIKQLTPEQQQEVFKFVEFIDFKQQQENKIENKVVSSQIREKQEQENFFSMAGIWENREIDINSLRQQAWRKESS